jgi:hypothetical protein
MFVFGQGVGRPNNILLSLCRSPIGFLFIKRTNKLKYEYEQSYEAYQDLDCFYEFKFYTA